VRANFLMSPPLVVAFALAGRVNIDVEKEPLGKGDDGRGRLPARHLADARRDRRSLGRGDDPETYRRLYKAISPRQNPLWNEIPVQ
jgi:aconitate hydratase